MSQPAPGCNGTTYVIKKAGDPDKGAISRGDTATVHATGVIKETGKKFWSTKDPGQQPFTYQAGVGGVIKGWDQGCLGMTVGEERELEIPARAPRPVLGARLDSRLVFDQAHEGYGANGFPAWGIPPGGTLNFTLECLNIKASS